MAEVLTTANQTVSVTQGTDGTKIGSGKTIPGATNWQTWGNDTYALSNRGIFVDIDTSAAGFTQTPVYVTSIHGDTEHWAVTGSSSVYNATSKGFRIYIRIDTGYDGAAPMPKYATTAYATEKKWHIHWIGIESAKGASSKPSSNLPTPGKDYYLVAKVSGKVLDVENTSTINGGNIYQYKKSGVPNQIWKLEDAGNGYYYLVVKHSGKVAVADYKGVTGKNLNNVVQYDKVGAEEQKWKLEDAGDGYFNLVNKATGKLLDVQDGGKDDKVNVQQCERNGTDAQKWKFDAV
jgi:hypothetical protein